MRKGQKYLPECTRGVLCPRARPVPWDLSGPCCPLEILGSEQSEGASRARESEQSERASRTRERESEQNEQNERASRTRERAEREARTVPWDIYLVHSGVLVTVRNCVWNNRKQRKLEMRTCTLQIFSDFFIHRVNAVQSRLKSRESKITPGP